MLQPWAGTAGFSISIQRPQSEHSWFWLMLDRVNTWADWTSRYRTHKWQQVYLNKAAASRPLCVSWRYRKVLLHQGLHCFVGIDFGHPAHSFGFASRCLRLMNETRAHFRQCQCWWRLGSNKGCSRIHDLLSNILFAGMHPPWCQQVRLTADWKHWLATGIIWMPARPCHARWMCNA